MIKSDDIQREITSLVRKGGVSLSFADMLSDPVLDGLFGPSEGSRLLDGVWFDPTEGDACFGIGDYVMREGVRFCVGRKVLPVSLLPPVAAPVVLRHVREYRSCLERRAENARLIGRAVDDAGGSVVLRPPVGAWPQYSETLLSRSGYSYVEGSVRGFFRSQTSLHELFALVDGRNFRGGRANILFNWLSDKCVDDARRIMGLRLDAGEHVSAAEAVRAPAKEVPSSGRLSL